MMTAKKKPAKPDALPRCAKHPKNNLFRAREIKTTDGIFSLGDEGQLIFKPSFTCNDDLHLENYVCGICGEEVEVDYADWED